MASKSRISTISVTFYPTGTLVTVMRYNRAINRYPIRHYWVTLKRAATLSTVVNKMQALNQGQVVAYGGGWGFSRIKHLIRASF